MRIQKRFFVSCSQCEREHFERKNIFRFIIIIIIYFFLAGGGVADKSILTKNYKILEFLKTSILPLGYQPFHTKKSFRDEMFLEISVRENVYP